MERSPGVVLEVSAGEGFEELAWRGAGGPGGQSPGVSRYRWLEL
jgi:hypothetical protein